MKRFAKSVLGVTLLEIMLVLAVAAAIIVMSVRYYQTATSSQQANATMSLINTYAAAMDNLAQGTGTYGGIALSSVAVVMSLTTVLAPWGDAITMATPAAGAVQYTVTIPNMPAAVCALVLPKLGSNSHFTGLPASCGAASSTADFSYTYKMNS
jgi:type II secretory pathway pseudopilin PulG